MLLIRNGYMIDPKSGLEGKYDCRYRAGADPAEQPTKL